MDANQRLMQFMEAVSRSTDAKVLKAEQTAEEEAEQILLEADRKCRADSEKTLAAAKARIAATYQKRMSQIGYEGRTAFLSRRHILLMQLFGELREKLTAFTASADYLPWMKKLLADAAPEDGAEILLRESDLALKPELEKTVSAKISFRADPAIRLGGLSVLSADGRRCRNHTLDEAYASQLRNFYRNHKIGGGDE